MLTLWSNVCVIWGFRSIGFRNHGATIPNGTVIIRCTSLIGVDHSRSDSIVPPMLCTICCVIAGALALYYRSFGIAPTLLRIGNISGIPYC
jgi:hypothetical protein